MTTSNLNISKTTTNTRFLIDGCRLFKLEQIATYGGVSRKSNSFAAFDSESKEDQYMQSEFVSSHIQRFGRIYWSSEVNVKQWIDIGFSVWLVEKSLLQCTNFRLVST
ncbi:uncharacterized protein LOC116404966 isoform X2 [Cucumis sativus]|uniref:uncharacterized protein LOC116404966 isoform X2 n=1 Tax=Cucumis sativus TaxID=3659 RepID=UPI0012F494EA|nr:uncharacterized protein LOC116404966 isoform X2 [Cucumis sativus]